MDYDCFFDIKENYNEFIDFALSLSDYITFHIGHYDILSPESLKMQEEYMKNHPEDCVEEDESYDDYYNKMSDFIEYIKDAILKTEKAFSYLGYKYGYLCETFVIDAKHTKVKEFLLSAGSIFSWRYPDFPEDICFFRNGQYWIRSVAHENLLFFSNITNDEAEKLKQLGVKLVSDE